LAFSTKGNNGQKGNSQKGKCYNCSKPGHQQDDCWEEGSRKEGQKPDWLKAKEKWQKEREGGSSGKEKDKVKESAKRAEIEEDVAWMAYLSDSESEDDNDDNDRSTISSDEGSVDWWDEPVEGKNEYFDERVNEAGSPSPNHPNLKPPVMVRAYTRPMRPQPKQRNDA
jgi:hypothetical protein